MADEKGAQDEQNTENITCKERAVKPSKVEQLNLEKKSEKCITTQCYISTMWGTRETEETIVAKVDETYQNNIFICPQNTHQLSKDAQEKQVQLKSESELPSKEESHDESTLSSNSEFIESQRELHEPVELTKHGHVSDNVGYDDRATTITKEDPPEQKQMQSKLVDENASNYATNISHPSNTCPSDTKLASRSQPLQNKSNINSPYFERKSNKSQLFIEHEEQKLTCCKPDDSLGDSRDSETCTDGDSSSLKEWSLQKIIDDFDKKHPDENNESSLYDTVLRYGVKSKIRDCFEELQKFCSPNGFEMMDTSANGNCMFQAINDQLRINGDFRFTVSSLRQLAVEYLIEHPTHPDGTPLSCYLDEDWSTYLSRMAQSCEWGDHLVLKALSDFLGRRMTVINAGLDDNFNHNEIIPDASDESRNETLYLGHLGEFHYLSLRPKGWNESWIQKARRNKQIESAMSTVEVDTDGNGIGFLSDPLAIDPVSKVPLPHLTFIVRQLIHQSDIRSVKIPLTVKGVWETKNFGVSGGGIDDTEVFLIRNGDDMDKLIGDYSQKFDDECPEMFLYPKEHEVIFDRSQKRLGKKQMRAETDDAFPGYCSLRDSKQMYLKTSFVTSTDHVLENVKFVVKGFICPKWPMCAEEWLSRETRSGWPSEEMKKQVVGKGCIVTHMHNPRNQDPRFTWQMVFSEAEEILYQEGLTVAQKYIFDVFKILVDNQIKHLRRRLTTLQIKHVFLFACEELDARCFDESPAACLLYVIEKLSKYVEKKQLPNYFVKRNNILDTLNDEETTYIKEALYGLRNFPIPSLVLLANEQGYSSTWMTEIVESDFDRYRVGSDVSIASLEIFFPLMIRMARKSIWDQRIDKCGQILAQAHNVLISSNKHCDASLLPNLRDLVIEVLPYLDVLSKYMLFHELYRYTGTCMYTQCGTRKKVMDLTNGQDIGGFGRMPVPRLCSKSLPECIYHEAFLLNILSAVLHNRKYDFESAIKYCTEAMDLLIKELQNNLKVVNSDLYTQNETVKTSILRYISQLDALFVRIYRNLRRSVMFTADFQILQHRMSYLEEACKRLQSPENVDLVVKIWEILGQPHRGVEFYESFHEQ